MANRKNNYSYFTKVSVRTNSSARNWHSTEKKIVKIEKEYSPIRKLKLTFEGGTRYNISENDEKFRYSDYFNVLWNNLKEDMIAEIGCVGMKIIDVQIDIPQ